MNKTLRRQKNSLKQLSLGRRGKILFIAQSVNPKPDQANRFARHHPGQGQRKANRDARVRENRLRQVVSAVETNAYPGTEMHRTMALIKEANFEKPFVLDIFKLESDEAYQYDLPFYFMGQVLQVNFEYDTPSVLAALGESSGYQHLYLEGRGRPSSGSTRFSWMGNGRFYTLTSATSASDELLFTRIGANDPEFNLRRDAAFMIRRDGVADTVFASVIEAHGAYSPVSEIAVNSKGSIEELKVVHDDKDYTAVSIEDRAGHRSLFILSNKDASAAASHDLQIGDKTYRWEGPYHYVDVGD